MESVNDWPADVPVISREEVQEFSRQLDRVEADWGLGTTIPLSIAANQFGAILNRIRRSEKALADIRAAYAEARDNEERYPGQYEGAWIELMEKLGEVLNLVTGPDGEAL